MSFTFDLKNFSLDPDNLGLHWAMYCANDVIEGKLSAAVPAPNATGLAMLGLALLGLGGFLRKRKSLSLRG